MAGIASSLGAGAAGGATVAIVIKAIDEFTPVFSKVNKSLLAVGGAITAIGIAGIATLSSTIKPASDLNESINAVNVSFGESAKRILEFGQNSAKAFGLSKNEFNSLAVSFSGFADNIVGPGGDVAKFINDLTTRGADFASVYNIEVADALNLFRSGLAGETEPLRRYGVDISAATVKNYALAHGIVGVNGELSESQKQQIRYNLILEQTAKTQGDFANTSDSLENRQRILNASVTDLKASLGEALLPVMENIVGIIQKAVDWFSQLDPRLRTAGVIAVAVGAGLLLIVGPLITIVALLPAIATGLGAVATGLTAVSIAGLPVWVVALLIAAALAALIAIGYLVIKHWDKLKEAAGKMSVFVQNAFIALGNIVLTVWNKIINYIEHSINQVIKAINLLISAYNSVASILGLGSLGSLSYLNLDRFKAKLMAYKEYVAPKAESGGTEATQAQQILSSVTSPTATSLVDSSDITAQASQVTATNTDAISTAAQASQVTATNTDAISTATNSSSMSLGKLEDINQSIANGVYDLVNLAKFQSQYRNNIYIQNINGLTGRDLANALQTELNKKVVL
jgi:hypothetical protein